LRPSAVHGASGDANPDVHHSRGLHRSDDVLGQGCHLWRSGCVSRDVVADYGADFCGDTTSHLAADASTHSASVCSKYSWALVGPNFIPKFGDSHFKANGYPDIAALGYSFTRSFRCTLCVAHVGLGVPALHGQPDQHGHEQRSRVWCDSERRPDVRCEYVLCSILWRLVYGVDRAARLLVYWRRGRV